MPGLDGGNFGQDQKSEIFLIAKLEEIVRRR